MTDLEPAAGSFSTWLVPLIDTILMAEAAAQVAGRPVRQSDFDAPIYDRFIVSGWGETLAEQCVEAARLADDPKGAVAAAVAYCSTAWSHELRGAAMTIHALAAQLAERNNVSVSHILARGLNEVLDEERDTR